MTSPLMLTVNPLVAKTEEYSASEEIDDMENLALSRVFIYNGAVDYTRFQGLTNTITFSLQRQNKSP